VKELEQIDHAIQEGTAKPKKKKKKVEKKAKSKKKVSKVENDYEINTEKKSKNLMAGNTGLPTFFFNKIETSVSVFQQFNANKKAKPNQVSSQLE
jgi:hypothetical protein